MQAADSAQYLRAEAKRLRDFVAHAESNRDDWYATMPVEVSERAIKKADTFDAAAVLLEEDAAAEAEIEKMLNGPDED